jgi:hypothetical protein
VGTVDLAVGALSASGAPLWSRSFGGAGATVSFDAAAPTATFGQISPDATGGAAEAVSVTGAVDFGGGVISGGGVLFRLDASGAFRWQEAPFSGFIASDPCGAVIAATSCAACAPGGVWGVSVSKLAP